MVQHGWGQFNGKVGPLIQFLCTQSEENSHFIQISEQQGRQFTAQQLTKRSRNFDLPVSLHFRQKRDDIYGSTCWGKGKITRNFHHAMIERSIARFGLFIMNYRMGDSRKRLGQDRRRGRSVRNGVGQFGLKVIHWGLWGLHTHLSLKGFEGEAAGWGPRCA